MTYYDSTTIYVTSATTTLARIARLDAIIIALELAAITATATSGISEADLDTGQSKVKMVYRNVGEIAAAIQGFEALRNKLTNQLNGRKRRLVDGSNFNGPGFC